MSKTIDWYLDKYGESHQNGTNKLIHWICVPTILFSLICLIFSIPFLVEKTVFFNWATVFLVGALIYYIRLSIPMFFGFLFIALGLLYGVNTLYMALGQSSLMLAISSFAIFFIAWVGQFIGHKIEGAKPSFLEDVQFLLIGPAWLLHFIYKKIGIAY
jgi:uncharacterized membrane protein YGL010W